MVSGHRPVVCLVTGYIEQGMSLARNLTLSDSVPVFFVFFFRVGGWLGGRGGSAGLN